MLGVKVSASLNMTFRLLVAILVSLAWALSIPKPIAAQTPTSGNPNLFGIAAHAWFLDPYGDQLYPALDELRVTTVRLSIDWKLFEPVQGTYDWSLYDRVFSELAKRHIIIVADFNTIPAWASTDPEHCGQGSGEEVTTCKLRDDMQGAYTRAAEAALTRYSWIRYWEFWNEPDIWAYLGGDTYLRNLRTFYDIAHRLNPEIQVAISSLSGTPYIGWLWNLSDEWYGVGHQPWDAIAYHPYNLDQATGSDGQIMPIRFDRIEELHQLAIDRGFPNMKLWITEYGWSNDPATDARNLVQSLDWMRQQPYIAFAHLHMLHDWSSDPVHSFGLMEIVPDASGKRELTPTTRFVPKPVYYNAFKNYPRDGLPSAPTEPGILSFPQTGHTLSGRFLSAWRERGGLAVLGYPLTRPYARQDQQGRWLLVQDFERGSLEYHPEFEGTSFEVEGTLVGRESTSGRQDELPFRPLSECHLSPDRDCFSETGHSLAYGFRTFWQQHGGLAAFGYPISEEFQERNPDTGQINTVQYFERARLEYHPEFAGTPYEVEVGRLTASALQRRGWLAPNDPRVPTWREFQ